MEKPILAKSVDEAIAMTALATWPIIVSSYYSFEPREEVVHTVEGLKTIVEELSELSPTGEVRLSW